MDKSRYVNVGAKLGVIAMALTLMAACTPHFNRDGQQRTNASAPNGLGVPVQDMTAQGGGSTTGVSTHYRVSRVVVGGNIQRIKTSLTGKSVQGGPQ